MQYYCALRCFEFNQGVLSQGTTTGTLVKCLELRVIGSPLKTLSERLDEHVGGASLARATGAPWISLDKLQPQMP